MSAAKTNILSVFFILAAVITIFSFSEIASAAPQTILNPAAPKKSAYPRIVIYTVSWCPHCRELKEYLTSRNIPFINRDVELDPAAMEELTQKYNTFGVPVVIIGKDQEVIKGFTAELFESAVSRVRSGSKP